MAVGGNYFPDGCANFAYPKPWRSSDDQQKMTFWNSVHQWYPTWNPYTEDHAMYVGKALPTGVSVVEFLLLIFLDVGRWITFACTRTVRSKPNASKSRVRASSATRSTRASNPFIEARRTDRGGICIVLSLVFLTSISCNRNVRLFRKRHPGSFVSPWTRKIQSTGKGP